MKNLSTISFRGSFGRPRSHIGLEITDQAIMAVELSIDRNKTYQITQMGILPLSPGIVENGKIIDEIKLRSALQQMWHNENWKNRKVHFALPSQYVMVRHLKFPNVAVKQLKKLIHYEVYHNDLFPFDQPVYDFVKTSVIEDKPRIEVILSESGPRNRSQMIEPLEQYAQEAAPAGSEQEKMSGKKANPLLCNVMLVGAPQDMVDQYIDIVRKSGLKMVSMECKALSLYRFIEVSQLIEPLSTFFAIHIQPGMTELHIFHQGQLLMTRSIPISYVARASWKTGAAAPDNSIPSTASDNYGMIEHLHRAYEELAGEIDRSINYFRYTLNYREERFQHIVVSGDMPDLAGLVQYMRGRFLQEIHIQAADFIKRPETMDLEQMASFAVPIGLALRGSGI